MEVGKSMSSEETTQSGGLADIFLNPSATLSKWYVAVGAWGLVLAVRNMMGQIHPTYRVSWGGLLTFEALADAFGNKDDAAAFVASDAIFMAFVGGMTFLGARGLIGNGDPAEWAKGIVTNDWYNDLLNFDAGWTLILGTWSVLASIVFYFYWGIAHMAWIDPGVYSIAIALMGLGLVLRMLSSVEDEE